MEAEAAALTLLAAVEEQQGVARDLQLSVQTALRELTLQKTELAKVAMAIEQGHQGYQDAIDRAIVRFQGSINDADETVSGYVVAALERHQAVFSKALQEATERSTAQVQQVTEVAAKETIGGLRQAAKASQQYANSAQQGLRAFRDRQWVVLAAAVLGGAALVFGGVVAATLDSEDRRARLSELDGQIAEREKRLAELQEAEAKRGRPAAPGPVLRQGR
jgi:hypothetical protein